MSDKREKFVVLAERRVNRALDDMRLIANLANRNNYTYADSDVQKIVSALESEMKTLKQKFSAGAVDDRRQFTLE